MTTSILGNVRSAVTRTAFHEIIFLWNRKIIRIFWEKVKIQVRILAIVSLAEYLDAFFEMGGVSCFVQTVVKNFLRKQNFAKIAVKK